MSDNNMPVAEAVGANERELVSYELAFHVLPTVAEGEVAAVFQRLKDMIVAEGGELGDEEAPARFDLAYEIIKYLEGRNRKFTSAYFGWVRFFAEPAKVAEIMEHVEGTKELLRHLLVKLTKSEEENPFLFHESIASLKQVQRIDVDEEVEAEGEESEESGEEKESSEETESEDKV
jgi:ribosomal protein S6